MKDKSALTLKKIKIINPKPKKEIKPKLNEMKLIQKKILRTKSEKERILSSIEKQKFNDLSHLFRNSQNSDIDIKWTLSLRSSELEPNSRENINRKLKFKNMKPPSFFEKDVEKFIKKKNERTDSYDDIVLPNLLKYKTLFRRRLSDTHGTTLNCRSLLDFELNLRDVNNENRKNKKKFKSSIRFFQKPKWDNSIRVIKKDDLKLINYSMDYDKTSSVSCLNEKYVNRPYQVLFKKMKYEDSGYIYQKKYIKDKNKAYNFLGGIHIEPYNDNGNYKEKQYNFLVEAIPPKERNHLNLSYHFNLRKYERLN